VIIGIVVAIVAVRRHRRELAEEELAQQEAVLAAAAAAERNRQQQIPPDDSPTRVIGHGPYGPPPSPDGYGLLSGRDNDYPPMPPAVAAAPTEVDPAVAGGPTQVVGPDVPEQPVTGRHSIPDEHDQPAAPATGPLPAVPAGDDAGPSTQAWTPDFAGEQPPARPGQPGPADGQGSAAGQGSADRPDDDAGPSTEQWRPDFGHDPDRDS